MIESGEADPIPSRPKQYTKPRIKTVGDMKAIIQAALAVPLPKHKKANVERIDHAEVLRAYRNSA